MGAEMPAAERDGPPGPPTRTDWAEQIIRGEILTARLRPGDRLKIGSLVARYEGLSPTPVREALSRLAGAGLVDYLPQRGVRVAEGSKEDLIDVYQNRILLETRALRQSMAAGHEAIADSARQAFAELEQASLATGDAQSGELSTADLMRWEDAHRKFHFSLISQCGSPWLLRLVNVLYENSIRYRYLTLEWEPVSMRNALSEHRRILAAVLSGDVDHSVTMLTDHMRLTIESVESVPALDLPTRRDLAV
jgi:GntR family transcriptional regulator, carbon starvation induced regulator